MRFMLCEQQNKNRKLMHSSNDPDSSSRGNLAFANSAGPATFGCPASPGYSPTSPGYSPVSDDEEEEHHEEYSAPRSKISRPKAMTEDEILQKLIALQSFEGFWDDVTQLSQLVKVNIAYVKAFPDSVDDKVVATCFAIAYLETKLAGKRDVWDLVVEKARAWLKEQEKEGRLGNGTEGVDDVIGRARIFL
jgi:hypothetical protein